MRLKFAQTNKILLNQHLSTIYPYNISLSGVSLKSCFSGTCTSLSYANFVNLANVHSLRGSTADVLIGMREHLIAVSRKSLKVFFSFSHCDITHPVLYCYFQQVFEIILNIRLVLLYTSP